MEAQVSRLLKPGTRKTSGSPKKVRRKSTVRARGFPTAWLVDAKSDLRLGTGAGPARADFHKKKGK